MELFAIKKLTKDASLIAVLTPISIKRFEMKSTLCPSPVPKVTIYQI